MANIHDTIKQDLARIKESAETVQNIAKKDNEQLRLQTEKINDLEEKDKKRILKELYENKDNESI